MHTFFPRIMRARPVLVLACTMFFMLVASMSAIAGQADKLNGTWMIDVDAMVARNEAETGKKISQEEVAAFRKLASELRFTFNIKEKTFVVQQPEAGPHSQRITSIEEDKDTVTLGGNGIRESYRFLPDGKVLVGSGEGLIIKKISK